MQRRDLLVGAGAGLLVSLLPAPDAGQAVAEAGRGALVGQAAGDQFGTPALEAAHRVRGFQLDAYRAAILVSQGIAPVQRRGQKDRIDHLAGRADPIKIEPGLDHGQSIYVVAELVVMGDGPRDGRSGS